MKMKTAKTRTQLPRKLTTKKVQGDDKPPVIAATSRPVAKPRIKNGNGISHVKVTEVTRSSEGIELFPHGISVSTALGRPVLILKDKTTVDVLPVWMNPLDAGVALAELSQSTGVTPHSVTRRLLAQLNVKLEKCVFTEIVGHHQFVDLTFETAEASKPGFCLTRVRADEAMSFCLQARARFFGTKAYMAQCRSLDVDLSTFENNLVQGQLNDLKTEIENSSKKNPYVI